MSRVRVNAKLAKMGLPIELVKGEGYFYFVYDDGNEIYETHSIMVYAFKDYTVDEWVAEAVEFAKAANERHSMYVACRGESRFKLVD